MCLGDTSSLFAFDILLPYLYLSHLVSFRREVMSRVEENVQRSQVV